MRRRFVQESTTCLCAAVLSGFCSVCIFGAVYVEFVAAACGLYLLVRGMLWAIRAWERSVLDGDSDK